MKRHNSTVKANKAKPVMNPKPVYEEYYRDIFTFKECPVSIDYLKRYAAQWVEWAIKNDDALKPSQFHILKGVSQMTIDRWEKRCKELEEAHHLVLVIIGNRREIGAITRKYEASMIKAMMPLYDIKWKEIEEWRAKMKSDMPDSETKIVVLESFPDNPTVKPSVREKINAE